jgi:hypothetical protein
MKKTPEQIAKRSTLLATIRSEFPKHISDDLEMELYRMISENENHTPFKLGEIVYLATDPDQHPRMVTGINIRGTGAYYGLAFGSKEETWHYDFEITSERDIVKLTS